MIDPTGSDDQSIDTGSRITKRSVAAAMVPLLVCQLPEVGQRSGRIVKRSGHEFQELG
jgi:hypothetical protein